MLDKKFAFPYPSLQHGEQSVESFFLTSFQPQKLFQQTSQVFPTRKERRKIKQWKSPGLGENTFYV